MLEQAAKTAATEGEIRLIKGADKSMLFGAAVMLFMVSKQHMNAEIWTLNRRLFKPLHLDQYFAFERGGRMVGFFTWADLTDEAQSHLVNRTRLMKLDDWNAGDGSNIWVIDGLAPYGGIQSMARQVRDEFGQLAPHRRWSSESFHWARRFDDGTIRKLGEIYYG